MKEKGKKRSKSQKRADLLSVSPDAQDAEDPAHKAAKVSKDTAKGKKQKKSKERADASDQGRFPHRKFAPPLTRLCLSQRLTLLYVC